FKYKIVLFFFLLISSINFAQNRYILCFTITDQNTNDTLIGVTSSVIEANINTITKDNGIYSISHPEGTYTLEVSYIGYAVFSESILVNANTRKNVSIEFTGVAIEGIEITGNNRAVNIRKPEMSVNKLTVEEIKKMPVVLGEVDILKSI